MARINVTQQDKDYASEVHPLDYLMARGEGLTRKGLNYYRHNEHDSLVINTNGKWIWNSQSVGGHGAISLARKLFNMGYLEAVVDIVQMTKGIEKRDFSNNIKGEFLYPKQYETNNSKELIDYLTQQRCLDPRIIQDLLKKGLIVQDKLKNVVFKWMENGEIVGADVQGTKQMADGKYFKHIMTNSKADGGFIYDVGVPDKIAFFESAIDSLSYLQLKNENNIRLVSMSGLKPQTVITHLRKFIETCIEQNKPIKSVVMGVDNDKAGNTFRDQWQYIIGESVLKNEVPQFKDWNKDLVELSKNLQIERGGIFETGSH